MATILAVNDILEVTVPVVNAEQVALNKTHWSVFQVISGAPTDQEFANYLDAILSPAYKGLIAADSTYWGVAVQRLSGSRGLAVFSSTGRIAGTGTGGSLPRQTAGVISLRTALAGRSQRGRVYIPFPAVQFLAAGGIPTAGYITGLGVIGSVYASPQTFVSAPDSAKLLPVILHRRLNTTSLILTSVELKTAFATQRRRGSYGRPNSPPF